MRDIQNKIRNGIANSYQLRSLAKDEKITKDERDRIYQIVQQNDKRIKYYMKMNNILREQKNGNNKKHL